MTVYFRVKLLFNNNCLCLLNHKLQNYTDLQSVGIYWNFKFSSTLFILKLFLKLTLKRYESEQILHNTLHLVILFGPISFLIFCTFTELLLSRYAKLIKYNLQTYNYIHYMKATYTKGRKHCPTLSTIS